MSKYLKYLSTAASGKLLGLLRDLLVLWNIGVGAALDSFYLGLVLPNLIMAFVSPVLYLNLVPQTSFGFRKNPEQIGGIINAALSQSLILGSLIFCIMAVLNALFVSTLATDIPIALAVLCALPVLFTVVAEYCSAILTVRKNLTPIIAGNIMINLPVIFWLAIFDVDVLEFAIVYSGSFLLRTLLLLFFVQHKSSVKLQWIRGSFPKTSFQGIKRSLQSILTSTASPAAQACLLISRSFCAALPEGSVTLYYYGMKLFEIVNGTFGLVLGTKFFSDIQNLPMKKIVQKMLRFSLANFLICIALYCIVLFINEWSWFLELELVQEYKVDQMLLYSVYALPLVFLLPFIDMYQRMSKTINIPQKSQYIAIIILGTCLALNTFAISYEDMRLIFAVNFASIFAGSVYAALQIIKLTRK